MSSQTPMSSAATTPPASIRPSVQAPAASRLLNAASTQDIVALKMRAKCLEDRAHVLESTIQALQERDEQSKEKIEELTLNLELVKARCERFEKQLLVLLHSVGVELKSLPTPAPAGPAAVESIVNAGQIKTESPAVLKDPSADIRKIVTTTLASLYGVAKFSMKLHGQYPTVSKMHMDWPSRMDRGVRVPLHRFDFSEGYGSSKNNDTYEAWIQLSLTQGPNLASVTHLSPEQFNKKTVISECGRFYSSLKTQHKKMIQKHAPPAVGIKRKVDAASGDEESQRPPENSPSDVLSHFSFTEFLQSDSFNIEDPLHANEPQSRPPILPAASDVASVVGLSNKSAEDAATLRVAGKNHPDIIRSRKVVRCLMRSRKRPLLKGDLAKYQLPKYDTFFTAGAMSEEEEVIDAVDEEGRATASHFEAHAYEWASPELIAIRDAIDSVPDPTTSNKTPRQRGTTKSGPPHTNTSVDGGMRTWMINSKVLAEHPEWLEGSLVYHSGPEWNEPEPKDPRGARKAAKRVRTLAVPGLELAQQADANVLRMQAKIEEFNNSRAV